MQNTAFPVTIGAIRGLIITDGVDVITPEAAAAKFVNHQAEIRALLSDEPINQCRNVLLLDVDGERILIDTGEGNFTPTSPGRLFSALRENDLAPESINTVILSHFHLDHIGGLLTEGKRSFPNARLIAAQAEYDYWMHPDFLATTQEYRSKHLRGIFERYPDVQLVSGETEIVPGVCLLPAHGHTPGHLAILIESQGTRLLHVVDAWHLTPQLSLPDAPIKYDYDPAAAVATRRALMDRAEAEGLLTLAYHFESPGVGYIRKDGDRRAWVSNLTPPSLS